MLNDSKRLPVAEVTVELQDKNIIKTKAIVAYKDTELTYYILGNETQKLIENAKHEIPQILNTVTMRKKKKRKNRNCENRKLTAKRIGL